MLKEIASVTQVYLVTGYTDLRLGIDGLAALVQGKLKLDPYSGSSANNRINYCRTHLSMV